MRKKQEKAPGLDDIVFESRNKEYGAYFLRKRYLSTMALGLVFSVFLGSMAIIIPYYINSRTSDMVLIGGGGGGSRVVNLSLEELPPPTEQIYVREIPPPPRPEEQAEIQEAVKYTPPEVVDSLPEFYEELATMDQILMDQGDTVMEIDNDLYFSEGYDFGLGEGTGTGAPFLLVEIMPSFRGGDLNSFRQWVQQRTNYPQEAIENNIQGRVMLTFIVEADGSVSNVSVIKSVHPSIDNEAASVISSSPKWEPGYQGGKPVRVRYSMWLGFVL